MNVLFEEGGEFKVGSILADNDTSLQIEAPHGKRSKIKAASVLLRFASPPAGDMLASAQSLAEDLDVDFLWEASGEDEFSFQDLAEDYFGGKPAPDQAAAILLRLHANPMYFYRKGKGHYRSAPADSLKAALASVERKQREQAQIEEMVRLLGESQLPESFRDNLVRILFRPDKQSLEYRALDQACHEASMLPQKLLLRCGAFASARDYHLGLFLAEHFPAGAGFDDSLPNPSPDIKGLPEATVAAFSIDDATTTEIDDAFSVQRSHDSLRVGIHIAAPALGIIPGSAFDDVAANRYSTVYMPGDKITMLPDSAVEQFTLKAGAHCPALSLYIDLDPDSLAIRSHESKVEMVHVAANLRHHELPYDIDNAPAFPWQEELRLLHKLSRLLLAGRGKEEAPKSFQPEYVFSFEGERVVISERDRGSPIDNLVSEMMIHVNSHWAELLRDAGATAIYRGQAGGKTRMTTAPTHHEGLGVKLYMWSSSPLRRYIDLLNQRQLVAVLTETPLPYSQNDERLMAAMHGFESAYDAYNSFQRSMERYWSLRYLEQEEMKRTQAVVLRENLVRFASLPIYMRLNDLPNLPPETLVDLEIQSVDLLDLEAHCRFLGKPEP